MSVALDSDKAVTSSSTEKAAQTVPSRRVSARQLTGLSSATQPGSTPLTPPKKTSAAPGKKTEESGVYAKKASGVGKRASVAPPPPARPLSSITAKTVTKASAPSRKPTASVPPPAPGAAQTRATRAPFVPPKQTSARPRPSQIPTRPLRSVRREEPSCEEIDVLALMPVAMPRPVTSLAGATAKRTTASTPPPPPAVAKTASVPPPVPVVALSAIPAVPAAPAAPVAAPNETAPAAIAKPQKKKRDWSIEFLLAPSPFHRDDRANLERYARFRLPTVDDVKRVAARFVAMVRRDVDVE